MNVALRPMTVDTFLAWEERQALRYEFDGIRPRAMTGGTAAHARIQVNLAIALGNRLRGKPCQPYSADMKLRLAGSVRYPDMQIICAPVVPTATWATEPVVVFEVLSQSTMHEDIVVKNAEYRSAPSIQRYVVLEQTHIAALVFTRRGEDWIATPLSGADAVLALPEVGIAIPLGEFYTDIALASNEPVADEDQPP